MDTRQQRLDELDGMIAYADALPRDVLNLILALAAEDLTDTYVIKDLEPAARNLVGEGL